MASLETWKSILSQNNFDVPFGYRVEFNIKCPFHNDKMPSLSVNIEKEVWICHAGCGQGRLDEFLARALNIPLLQITSMLMDKIVEFDAPLISEIPLKNDDEEPPLIRINYDYDTSIVPTWILDRGFATTTLKQWKCGYNKTRRSLVIPVFEQDILIGAIERQPPDVFPKYLYTPGFKKSHTLFGENFIKQQETFVCLVEGSLDAIWLHQNNYPAVALLGVYMSRVQERKMLDLHAKEIILCLDNDEAGRKASDNIHQKLNKYCIVSKINIPQDCKDVQDIRNPKSLKKVIFSRICQ